MGGLGFHLAVCAYILSLKGLALHKSPRIHRKVEVLTAGLPEPCRSFLPALPHLGWRLTGPLVCVFCHPTVDLGEGPGVIQPFHEGITGSGTQPPRLHLLALGAERLRGMRANLSTLSLGGLVPGPQRHHKAAVWPQHRGYRLGL